MKIKDGFKLSELAGGFVAMRENPDPNGITTVISLNKTSAFLWECLQNDTDRDTLVKKLTETYAVDVVIAQRDVDKFIENCRAADILD